MAGAEPALSVLETDALPLSYTGETKSQKLHDWTTRHPPGIGSVMVLERYGNISHPSRKPYRPKPCPSVVTGSPRGDEARLRLPVFSDRRLP